MKSFATLIMIVNIGSAHSFDILRSLSTMMHMPEVYEGSTEGSIDIFYKTFKKHPMKLPDETYKLQDQIRANAALV